MLSVGTTFDTHDKNHLDEKDDGASTIKRTASPPTMPLCQINNHPDFRLKQAKDRFALGHNDAPPALGKDNISALLNENPSRKNDGTSSGAKAEDRLRTARRKAMESIKSQTISSTSLQSNDKGEEESMTAVRVASPSVSKPILSCENPARTNDKTSSGAIAEERLRLARRKALQSIVSQRPSSSSPSFSRGAKRKVNRPGEVKQYGINITSLENPIKVNDGTSSGAKAEDRLRLARRRILENMKKPKDD